MRAAICHPAKTSLVALFLLCSISSLHAGTIYNITSSTAVTRNVSLAKSNKISAERAAKRAEMRMILATATVIYDEMGLEDSGLNRKAFESAWTGYYKLKKKGLLRNTGILSICDFSQSSSNQRLYVIDVRNHRLLYRTFVAHGINSGESFASSFSNRMESCKSSLGFYVTSTTYNGANGLSLRIDGLDKGFNDNARKRAIVIHGASYVSNRILKKYGVMGTTFGCPAIPTDMTSQIIPVVKNGSCFFIYYPSRKYLAKSAVLNS
jgi:hypothetical protein